MFEDYINYAIQFAINSYKNNYGDSKCFSDRLFLECLKRSEVVWSSLRIHGLEFYGLTYDEFCKQCEEKNHIVFLSDDEAKLLNKAFEIMDIIKN